MCPGGWTTTKDTAVQPRHETAPVGARFAMRGEALWQAILALGLVLTIVYTVAPYARTTEILYVAIGGGAAIGILVAVRVCHPAHPLAWWLLAGAVAVTAVGDATWIIYEAQGIDPFPSIADAFYLAAYPIFAAALWSLGGRRDRDYGALTDALIVGISAAVLGWVFLVAPHLQDPTLTLGQRLISLAYPVGDLILLPLALRLVFRHGARVTAHLLMLLGLAVFLIADVLFAVASLEQLYVPGGITDGMWLVAYVLFVAAAWHPSASVVATATRSVRDLSPRRLAFLAAAAVVSPVIILIRGGSDDMIITIAAGASILLFLLVVLRMAGLVQRIRRQSTTLEDLTRTDPLTGASNRRYLDVELPREISRAERTSAPLCLAMLDLDHFKPFNDTFGHPAGDALLRELVTAWRDELRPVDLLIRFGGEEFIVVFPASDLEQTEVAVERLRSLVPQGQTCSAGIAERLPGEDGSELIARTDLALYAAKESGRDRTVRADEAALHRQLQS